MQYLTKLIFAASLAGALFTPNATSQDNNARQLSFDSIIKTEDKGTSVLVIPMNGQMSTDITIDAYRPLKSKIEELNPDLIVLKMLCQDFVDDIHEIERHGDEEEKNRYNSEQIEKISKLFRIDLKNIDQVLWIEDSYGASTVLSLSWPNIYMSKKARLIGDKDYHYQRWNYIAPNLPTWGKMYKASIAHAKTAADMGERSHHLVLSFIDPGQICTGTYEGRNVIWEDNLDGYLILDTEDFKSEGGRMNSFMTYPFRIYSDEAESFAISKGTVRDLEEVLLNEGIREYHLVGENLTESIDQYKIDWRKALVKATDYIEDFKLYREWVTGEDAEKYLRKQLNAIKQVYRLMKNWDAIEQRMKMKNGLTIKIEYKEYGYKYVPDIIKQIEEQLRKLRENEDSGRGRRGGGGLAGSSGGGGIR